MAQNAFHLRTRRRNINQPPPSFARITHYYNYTPTHIFYYIFYTTNSVLLVHIEYYKYKYIYINIYTHILRLILNTNRLQTSSVQVANRQSFPLPWPKGARNRGWAGTTEHGLAGHGAEAAHLRPGGPAPGANVANTARHADAARQALLSGHLHWLHRVDSGLLLPDGLVGQRGRRHSAHSARGTITILYTILHLTWCLQMIKI